MRLHWLVLLLCAAVCLIPCPAKAAEERPNIIMMSDDMGFSDIGCYGGEIETPNLDALAADGLHFTQFYNTGRCCPTRASLLTGLHPHQAEIGHMMRDRNLPGYRSDLARSAMTISEVLRAAWTARVESPAGRAAADTSICFAFIARRAPDKLLRGFANQPASEKNNDVSPPS